jgi:hypothetical protein
MRIPGFIKNKYSVAAIILVCLLLADIILHKGMSRVIIPSGFSDNITIARLSPCNQSLVQKEKNWIRAVDNTSLMSALPQNTAGIGFTVYYDSIQNRLEVYQQDAPSLNIDTLLNVYSAKKLHSNIWLKLKNLNAANAGQTLDIITGLRDRYRLFNQVIVESSSAEQLVAFCQRGFFTSYYVPHFNPYQLKENDLKRFIDSIRVELTKYPTSAISGYYFQYPALKKFFPNYPILTWADKSPASIVSYTFNLQLKNDTSIRAILYNYQD